ncbi:hypothetical protein TNCV_195421 [Trichonephila clavipes]|uniref:Uncharacterized protein n=1 Tax=Trichonephila clavipes TaxID=2585209 RepID=A0A8X7BMA9_TRICX|nr:hypothetical protein TNCV_195421 [Trichonephila clavipes]
MAMKNNINDQYRMKVAVWAVYFHLLSSNEGPQQGLCPAIINARCKFQKTKAECNEMHCDRKHTHHNELDEANLYRYLGDPMLLRKC